jgi:hypothetical protein
MREDQKYRAHFRTRVDREPVPANPWRGAALRAAGQAKSGWSEERRPSRLSWFGYAAAAACLLVCLSLQSLGWYDDDPVSRGAAHLLSYQAVREATAGFLDGLRSLFQ